MQGLQARTSHIPYLQVRYHQECVRGALNIDYGAGLTDCFVPAPTLPWPGLVSS